MAKGILLDFDSVARRTGGDSGHLLREIQNLGYDVYRREFLAACDYVMYVDASRKGLDSAEHFLEAVLGELQQKPTRTELMSLAPVFGELHRHALYEDVVRALPALAKGHRLVVVSSLPPFLVAHVLETVKSHILTIVTPKEAKAIPPNPAVYRAALTTMRLRPRDVLLVSPHCADLTVGKPIGLRPVFLRRQAGEPCPDAVATVQSLDELEAALRPAPKPQVPPKAPDVPKPPAPARAAERPPEALKPPAPAKKQ